MKEIGKQFSSSFHISFISGQLIKTIFLKKQIIFIYNVISANEMNNKALDIFPNVDICILQRQYAIINPKKIST